MPQDFEGVDVHLVALRVNALLSVAEARRAAKSVAVRSRTVAVENAADSDRDSAMAALDLSKAVLRAEEDAQEQGVTVGRVMAGARGSAAVLGRRVRLRYLPVVLEARKFLVQKTDKAALDAMVECIDGTSRALDEAVFQCAAGNANFDWRFVCAASDGGKPVFFAGQDKHSAVETTDATVSGPEVQAWYNVATGSMKPLVDAYDVVVVFVTNRRFTSVWTETCAACPQLLLVSEDELDVYLSPTFAHRGLLAKDLEP